jgi:hypothetical protein
MAAPDIPLKFIKTLTATGSLTTTETGRFFIKLLYEFWGFCVNGGDNVFTPGGFAPVSGVIAPANFESGSTVLWATGQDGRTDFGADIFHSDSVNFINLSTQNNGRDALVGKYLVTWKPDSDSTDDSIYPIIGYLDANTIRVEVQVGGTRRLGNKAFFRKRDGIKFRVVDILAATKLAGWNDGTGLVLQFNKASEVNPGQANSQVKVSLRTTQQNVGLIVSPSGSWTGTAFTDGSPEMLASTNWFIQAGVFNSWVLIGGRDSLLVNYVPIDPGIARLSSGIHVEIPKRLYTGSLDPNPIAYNLWAQSTPSQLSNNYTNMHMVGEDGVARNYVTQARCPWGLFINTSVTAVSGGIWQNFSQTLSNRRYVNFNFNPYTDRYITSDAVLGCLAAGHYNLARARLRRVRFTSNNQQRGFRYGDIDWVFVANGVLWPWDNTIQGYGIQPENL